MGGMTIKASGNFFVPTVAAVAKQFGVAAGRGFHPLSDFRMAGETFFSGRLERVTQGGPRLMWIGVALEAVANQIVRLSLVTVDAGEDADFPAGWMLWVAVKAADYGGVLSTAGGDHSHLVGMAFRAIFHQ